MGNKRKSRLFAQSKASSKVTFSSLSNFIYLEKEGVFLFVARMKPNRLSDGQLFSHLFLSRNSSSSIKIFIYSLLIRVVRLSSYAMFYNKPLMISRMHSKRCYFVLLLSTQSIWITKNRPAVWTLVENQLIYWGCI